MADTTKDAPAAGIALKSGTLQANITYFKGGMKAHSPLGIGVSGFMMEGEFESRKFVIVFIHNGMAGIRLDGSSERFYQDEITDHEGYKNIEADALRGSQSSVVELFGTILDYMMNGRVWDLRQYRPDSIEFIGRLKGELAKISGSDTSLAAPAVNAIYLRR